MFSLAGVDGAVVSWCVWMIRTHDFDFLTRLDLRAIAGGGEEEEEPDGGGV